MNYKIPPGVITGKKVQEVFNLAKKKSFALPAVNVIGSNSINAVLETAKELNSPVIIQFSSGGSQFISGKGMPNNGFNSSISGSITSALGGRCKSPLKGSNSSGNEQ